MKGIIYLLFFIFPLGLAISQNAENMQKGDEAYKAFDNSAALKYFQEAVKADSSNCEALWKLARAYVDVGEVSEEDVMESYYLKAEKYSRRAVAVCPTSTDAHLELAVAVGRVALMSGPKKKVNLSKLVKTEAEKALELDPNNDIACHVLGRWHREVTHLNGFARTFAKILYGGLPPASDEKALEYFNKAIELNPDYINHHLELGITYQMMDNWQQAKIEFEKIANLPMKDSQDPDHKKEAENRLQEVEKKLK
jgi:tetratricopeptide (TPR) repeat protein